MVIEEYNLEGIGLHKLEAIVYRQNYNNIENGKTLQLFRYLDNLTRI